MQLASRPDIYVRRRNTSPGEFFNAHAIARATELHNAVPCSTVRAVDAERKVLTCENAFRALHFARRPDVCYTFFAFPPVGSDFPYASSGNIVRMNTYAGARAQGKLTSREGSIDALSPVRPETPSRNKPAREEDDGAAQ